MYRHNLDSEERLSEEIIENSNFKARSEYGIYISKECDKKQDDDNYFIHNTKVCWHCFYDEFFRKMKSFVTNSKQKRFISYQLNLRSQPILFLAELQVIIQDVEKYLDHEDYGISSSYLDIIENQLELSNSGFHEKQNLLLKKLYINREIGEQIDLLQLAAKSDIPITYSEAIAIAEYLGDNGYIKYTAHTDGISAKITGQGILEVEEKGSEDYNSNESKVHMDRLLSDLIHHIDLKFADLDVTNAEANLELANMIDELHITFKMYSKPTVSRIVKMKLAETIATETFSKGIVEPSIKRLLDF